MIDAIMAVYLITALAMAAPAWHVTGSLGQPQWVRVILTLLGPVVLATAIARRLTLGRW